MRNHVGLVLATMLSGALALSCKKTGYIKPDSETSPNNPLTPYTIQSGASSPHLIFEETVEGDKPFSQAHSWETGDWDYAINFVTDPHYQGQKSVRFEIRDDQPLVHDGKRSEICIVKGSEGDIDRNTWYSFAIFFPSDYDYDNEPEVLNQWYQNGSPATSLRGLKDRVVLISGNTMDNRVTHDVGPIVKNGWTEYVFHFIHSFGPDGLIEVWLNGTKILTLHGGNMYDDVLPKWKIGLYKSAFKYGTSSVHKRVVYFDNVRVGDSTATFNDMTSGNVTPPPPPPPSDTTQNPPPPPSDTTPPKDSSLLPIPIPPLPKLPGT